MNRKAFGYAAMLRTASLLFLSSAVIGSAGCGRSNPDAVPSPPPTPLPASTTAAGSDQWPQWRGPNGDGTSDAGGLPSEWDAADGNNVVWRVALTGSSAATPAVWGDRVFLVAPEREDVYALCLSLTDGKQLWKRKIGTGNGSWGFNQQNNMCAPSPCTDGKRVWFHAGGKQGQGGGLHCFTMDGNPVWSRDLQKDHGEWTQDFGSASSPLLHGDALYLPVCHRPDSYLVALNKATGAELWRTPRNTDAQGETRDGYGTPIAVTHGGRTDIVLCAADLLTGYDPKTGKELWRSAGLNPAGDKTFRICSSPVAGEGLVVACGAKTAPILAVRCGGAGDVTESGRAWTLEKETPDVATPALHAGLLYIPRKSGIVCCVKAADGQVTARYRIAGKGELRASPLIADGKVYVATERGTVLVFAEGPELKLAATNDFNEPGLFASPVAVGNRLLFRTGKALWCIGRK